MAQLQAAHMRTVPFENLDIQNGTALVLDEPALFDKIVERHRGGICYELNGTFAALLRELGYTVTLVSAQVCLGDGKLTPDFDHMALLVDIGDQRYLVDVGFGDPASFLAPLALAERGVQHAAGGRYQLTLEGDHYTVAKLTMVDGAQVSKPMYRFATTPRALGDFVPQSHFHQESMDAPFRRKVFCSMANTDGRATIHGDALTVIRDEVGTTTQLAGPEEVARAIEQYFALKL